MSLGKKVNNIRKKERDLTLDELAKKTGLSKGYLSKLENGDRFPKPDTLRKLSKGLGVPYADLAFEAGYTNEAGSVEAESLAEAFRLDHFFSQSSTHDLYEILTGDYDVYYKETFLNDDDKRFLLDILKRSINKEGD